MPGAIDLIAVAAIIASVALFGILLLRTGHHRQ